MIEVQNIHALRMMFSVIFHEWMTFYTLLPLLFKRNLKYVNPT